MTALLIFPKLNFFYSHIPIKETACGKYQRNNELVQYFIVEMRNACQVTNQSSHGELSFHHNPLPSAFAGACASLLLALFGAVAQE